MAETTKLHHDNARRSLTFFSTNTSSRLMLERSLPRQIKDNIPGRTQA
ncbi:hypothetical protein DHBDCA_p2510 [Dehalobacter sp. DCA]|nr:hypothetical protein DHBDCA_p2510 [Dehalobacter sp. DCA]